MWGTYLMAFAGSVTGVLFALSVLALAARRDKRTHE